MFYRRLREYRLLKRRKTEIITAMCISKGVPFDNISPITSLYFTIRKAFMLYI